MNFKTFRNAFAKDGKKSGIGNQFVKLMNILSLASFGWPKQYGIMMSLSIAFLLTGEKVKNTKLSDIFEGNLLIFYQWRDQNKREKILTQSCCE